MSFGSDPGRDDGSLPPANIVIPDDARELDRDLIAYRREQRARRRRQRLMRLVRPVRGNGTVLPLIATCVALSMLAGAMLSVVTISPASAPTVPATPTPTSRAGGLPTLRGAAPNASSLPRGRFTVYNADARNGTPRQVTALKTAAVALVPANCGCDQALRGLAQTAGDALVGLYFVAEGKAIPQIRALTARDGKGLAVAAADTADVFGARYHPSGLTMLLVYSDGTARVIRGAGAASSLTPPTLRSLTGPGR